MSDDIMGGSRSGDEAKSADRWLQRGEALLHHWFGDEEDGWKVSPDRFRLWFEKSDETDAELRDRFGDLAAMAHAGELDHWSEQPRRGLALVLLLDQLPRNLHRGKPEAFASDPKALKLARLMIARGDDRKLRPVERPFVYLPLEHAEDRVAQQQSVSLFRALAAEAPDYARAAYDLYVDYAVRHQVIVERFGRFPHRNAILGRPSTPEEEIFLTQPNSSF